MHVPMITANYLAILALLYTVLALQVMRLRQGNRADFGDGDSARLRSAIRVHANFAEYVPIIALMVALLEMSGASALRVHVLMGTLLVSRLLHPLGMYAKPNTLPFCGIAITIGLLIASALMILTQFGFGATN